MVRKIRCNLLFAIGEVYFISEIYFTYIDRLNMKNILRELREKNNWTHHHQTHQQKPNQDPMYPQQPNY